MWVWLADEDDLEALRQEVERLRREVQGLEGLLARSQERIKRLERELEECRGRRRLF